MRVSRDSVNRGEGGTSWVPPVRLAPPRGYSPALAGSDSGLGSEQAGKPDRITVAIKSESSLTQADSTVISGHGDAKVQSHDYQHRVTYHTLAVKVSRPFPARDDPGTQTLNYFALRAETMPGRVHRSGPSRLGPVTVTARPGTRASTTRVTHRDCPTVPVSLSLRVTQNMASRSRIMIKMNKSRPSGLSRFFPLRLA